MFRLILGWQVNLVDKPWKFTATRAVLLAVLLTYVCLAVSDAVPLQWRAAWIPATDSGAHWFAFASIAAILTWAEGWLLPLFSRRGASLASRGVTGDKLKRHEFVRFYVRACALHSGSLWGLIVSFQNHDARYAIVFAALSALMILLLPRPKPRDAATLGA